MALLEIESLSMRFGGLVALDGLSMHADRGEIVGLIGPNGSGKTTCFNVMTGIYAPSGGQVLFDGEDISCHRPQRVARAGIARTFQRSRLCLPLSVFDNLMVGNHARLNHGLWFNLFRRRALRKAFEQAVEDATILVQAFDSALGRRLFDAAASLPMIDRRRIEICRALIGRPRLLLLDEPSAGMTHEETRQLMDDVLAMRERMPGLTIIVIEHEMAVIERITDRCVVLNYGRKIAEGGYRDVAADPDVRAAYLGDA